MVHRLISKGASCDDLASSACGPGPSLTIHLRRLPRAPSARHLPLTGYIPEGGLDASRRRSGDAISRGVVGSPSTLAGGDHSDSGASERADSQLRKFPSITGCWLRGRHGFGILLEPFPCQLLLDRPDLLLQRSGLGGDRTHYLRHSSRRTRISPPSQGMGDPGVHSGELHSPGVD